jgi:hypothetical protein
MRSGFRMAIIGHRANGQDLDSYNLGVALRFIACIS